MGGFSVFRLLMRSKWRGEVSVSRKKADPGFVPEVIEEDGPEFMAAFVPCQIEIEDGYDPALEGFPLNVLFAGTGNAAGTRQQSPVEVCYEPAPGTFREDSKRKEICYFTKPKNGYSVRVVFEKATGQWRTEKFKGKKLIRTAFASTYDQVMIHTTMGGLEPDER
jgi:hypothetical protein